MEERLKETTRLTNEIESGSNPPKESANSIKAIRLTKKPVGVLTKLPEYEISEEQPPTPGQFYCEDESVSSSDSDIEWKPLPLKRSLSNKKMNEKIRKRIKIGNKSCSSNNNLASDPVIITSTQQLSPCNNDGTKVRPKRPEQEVTVGMMVIARKRTSGWERGKIVETVTKEDGRMKYKVSFEGKGKRLVSGHHIAFDSPPKRAQLYIGDRVVVQCPVNKFRFLPGILAELPCRRNRQRFLVFIDDHTPVYVGLPLLHLVCKQLDNTLEDVPDSTHKTFMERYLKDWPHLHLAQYTLGQSLNAELNGVQQRCEVLVVDCSLIQVVFTESQSKEWIHRGSTRLERVATFLALKCN